MANREFFTCNRCGRGRWYGPFNEGRCDPCKSDIERARGGVCFVVHDGYGCDTGCCGHRFYVEDARGNVLTEDFEFAHGTLNDFRGDLDALANKWQVRIAEDRCKCLDDRDCPNW